MAQAADEMSEGEFSDGALKIVIESPKRKSVKKRKTSMNIDPSEKQIIESIEKELEKTLEEKATKSNLTVHNVKNILRQVATNEHVLALVRQTENPDAAAEPPFEPKITRAKAKELYSTQVVTPLPWLPSTKPSSEVQQLISEELAEDSSGDEYVPAEEESEDDRDSSVLSESEIRSPATPYKPAESPKEVHWTDDGIFKIPPAKTQEEKEEEAANIALRTRSKLSYSTTPLETLEEAFIPPDITTDMYDMDCDDDVYRDFLRKFTRPLDEITKATEDEDHDPEYNILADEEIDEVDTEELRADKAVTITRKEVNDLMAELFEYANAFSEDTEISLPKIDLNIEQPQVNILEDGSLVSADGESQSLLLQNTTGINTTSNHNISTIEPSCDASYSDIIRMDQKLLFEQQMRQHVQMLTQNFLLTYEHPEFHDSSIKFKENLVNFQLLSGNKENSAFKASNLDGALKLVHDWEKQFALNTDEVRVAKQHVCQVIYESKQNHSAGIEHIPTFPQLVLETVSKNDVFLYPALLPRIPFKTASLNRPTTIIRSEDELIALGMEQFIPYLAQDSFHLTYKGQVKLTSVCKMIGQYMMPSKDIKKLYCHVFNSKHPSKEMNPIKYYFENNKAPVTMHYVVSLKEFGVVSPSNRNKELLPYQWRKYLYPEEQNNSTTTSQVQSSFTKVPKPPAFNKNYTNKTPPKRRLAPKAPVSTPQRNPNAFRRSKISLSPIAKLPGKGIFSSTPKAKPAAQVPKTKKLESYFKSPVPRLDNNISTCVRCMKFNSSIFEKLKTESIGESLFDMLPSMPFLGAPCNNTRDADVSVSEIPAVSVDTSKDCTDGSSGKSVEADSTIVDVDDEEIIEKDGEEDGITVATSNSTIKSRRGLSRGEKKKEKLRKEYGATLSMLTPEDPTVIQEKAQSYAQAYFDKARERLDSQDYTQFMEILNTFSERTNNVSDLYKQMEAILGQKHQDLMDEFLTFLTPAQAKDVGKLIPYYMLSNMSLFLRKLEIYFKEQPAQLRKIYRSLTDLSSCMNVTMERVKNTILPLLKGNNLLTDWFLQIFPCEPPPASLLKGPWENVDIRREFSSSEDVFETVTVPEVEDPYGGPNCICSCHQGDDLLFKSRSQHCVPCGIKFLQGRVYIQTGKGLRLANVTFNDSPDIDHNSRLNCSSTDRKKRRSETSPAKQITSPVKDCQEEVRAANDSEDDTESGKRKSRITRSPRKKRVKFLEKCEKANDKQVNEEQAEPCDIIASIPDSISIDEPKSPENLPKEEPLLDIVMTTIEDCADLDKPVAEEITEWDCNTSIESVELRQSPEHSAESESEFCEESSQDNINTETDDSAEELESLSNSPVHSENSNSNTCEEIWTRDQDKIILETLQKEGDKEDAFIRISEVLGNRSVPQIKERFDTLINLLQKMASCSNSTF